MTNEFSKFFKVKEEFVAKASGGSEEKLQRDAIVAKINAVAKSEGIYFEYGADGVPKVSAI